MTDARCAQCGQLYDEDELIQREDNGQMICIECSGLLADEDLGCQYEETG